MITTIEISNPVNLPVGMDPSAAWTDAAGTVTQPDATTDSAASSPIKAFNDIEKKLKIFEAEYTEAHYWAIVKYLQDQIAPENRTSSDQWIYKQIRAVPLASAERFIVETWEKPFAWLDADQKLDWVRKAMADRDTANSKLSDAVDSIYTDVGIFDKTSPVKMYEFDKNDRKLLQRIDRVAEWDPNLLGSERISHIKRLVQAGKDLAKTMIEPPRGKPPYTAKLHFAVIHFHGGLWGPGLTMLPASLFPRLVVNGLSDLQAAIKCADRLSKGTTTLQLEAFNNTPETTIINALELLGISNRQITIYSRQAAALRAFAVVPIVRRGLQTAQALTHAMRMRAKVLGYEVGTVYADQPYSMENAVGAVEDGIRLYGGYLAPQMTANHFLWGSSIGYGYPGSAVFGGIRFQNANWAKGAHETQVLLRSTRMFWTH
ncbi:MAG: hypothetical protein JWM36_2671 [Hyphomicrobiales bacterium]|nr:hypothetical protein [Hyphomicrobiales bacterium]